MVKKKPERKGLPHITCSACLETSPQHSVWPATMAPRCLKPREHFDDWGKTWIQDGSLSEFIGRRVKCFCGEDLGMAELPADVEPMLYEHIAAKHADLLGGT